MRWVTILTDAPLETGKPQPNQCGDCRKCVDACPPDAFSGRPFDPDEHRDLRFNTRRCIDYRTHLGNNVTGARVCGMCIFACPFGKNGANQGDSM
jgi:epoxyqueuosine reductase QueG